MQSGHLWTSGPAEPVVNETQLGHWVTCVDWSFCKKIGQVCARTDRQANRESVRLELAVTIAQ
jgi:hypothetical protein